MGTLDQESKKISLGNLDLLAKKAVEGFIIGLHKSPFHGFSVEFAEHRLYNPGESTKNIDWKVYARSEKLFTKRYEEETNLRCHVLMDCSSSMFYPTQNHNKFNFSVLAAATLFNLLKKQRDAFGLSAFNDKVLNHFPCKSSTLHYNFLISQLELLSSVPKKQEKSHVVGALHQVAESIHKRSLVVIFSDMLENIDSQEELFSALQHLKYNKHEVILFHTMDYATELRFEFEERPYEFKDMETGEKIVFNPKQVSQLYRERIKTHMEELKMKCLQYKIDWVPTDINKGVQEVLQTYLVKRKRMNIR